MEFKTYIEAVCGPTSARSAQIDLWGAIEDLDTSGVTSMSGAFNDQSSHCQNPDISLWDVSTVSDMDAMFEDAEFFNQDLSAWDVSTVINMAHMFERATAFNQDLSAWNLQAVRSMRRMFDGATSFTGDGLNGWDMSSCILDVDSCSEHMFSNSPSPCVMTEGVGITGC